MTLTGRQCPPSTPISNNPFGPHRISEMLAEDCVTVRTQGANRPRGTAGPRPKSRNKWKIAPLEKPPPSKGATGTIRQMRGADGKRPPPGPTATGVDDAAADATPGGRAEAVRVEPSTVLASCGAGLVGSAVFGARPLATPSLWVTSCPGISRCARKRLRSRVGARSVSGYLGTGALLEPDVGDPIIVIGYLSIMHALSG